MPRTAPPAFTRELSAFLLIAWRLAQYLGYRFKLRPRPSLLNDKEDVLIVLARLLGWRKRLRIIGRENCPTEHPTVFCANHARIGDPFVIECCIHWASRKLWVDHMMRNDFFPAVHKNIVYDADELLAMLGAHQIDRDNVTIGQLKVYVNLLKKGRGFLMFPMGTRSRTGFFMEPRDTGDEPGGCSFFVAQAQKANPHVRIPVTPIGRSYDPVTRETAVVFGAPHYLEPGADRKAQREFDLEIAAAIGELVEVNAAHLVAALLYLAALHGGPMDLDETALSAAAAHVAAGLAAATAAPELQQQPQEACMAALAHFEKARMLRRNRDSLALDRDRILSCPPPDRTYRKLNPVKFQVNQILHLDAVIAAIEEQAAILRAGMAG